MISFSELRPSYTNFLEFVQLGYKPEFVNIYLGFLLILATSFYIFRAKENIHIKLIAWYFSLSFFTNFAYQMYRARIFDFIGIAISLIVILILFRHKLKIWPFEKILLILTAVLLLHLLTLYLFGYFEKYGAGDRVFLQRLVMLFRLGVLFLVVLYFTNFVRNERQISFIVSAFKYTGLATIFIMVLQEILFFGFGYSTVGLNFASGLIPIPRFGSVAIEGGHFGKLMPTFLVYFLAHKKDGLKVTPLFFFLVLLSITNISASFYGYLVFIFLSMIVVNTFILKIRGLKLFLTITIAGTVTVVVWFHEYFLPFWQKVSGLLFKFGDKYDQFVYRNPDFLYKSLSEFPLGIGFGASNRFLPDGSFTDTGIYAIVSQLSILSLIILLFFFYYWLFTVRCFTKYKRKLLKAPYAAHSLIMVLATPFIFFFDIVWLYPGYILPFLILAVYLKKEKLERLGRTQEACLIQN